MKVKYNVKKAEGETIANWMVNLMSKRLGVKPPLISRTKSSLTGYKYPNLLLLSGAMFYESVQKFVSILIHEMAHYVHLHKLSKKEYAKIKRQHNKDFYATLKIVAGAAYGAEDGYKAYPWAFEYPRIIRYAEKDGLIERKKRAR